MEARSNIQNSNRFAELLEMVFQPNAEEAIANWNDINQEVIDIRTTTPKEVATEIKENINPKEATGI